MVTPLKVQRQMQSAPQPMLAAQLIEQLCMQVPTASMGMAKAPLKARQQMNQPGQGSAETVLVRLTAVELELVSQTAPLLVMHTQGAGSTGNGLSKASSCPGDSSKGSPTSSSNINGSNTLRGGQQHHSGLDLATKDGNADTRKQPVFQG